MNRGYIVFDKVSFQFFHCYENRREIYFDFRKWGCEQRKTINGKEAAKTWPHVHGQNISTKYFKDRRSDHLIAEVDFSFVQFTANMIREIATRV